MASVPVVSFCTGGAGLERGLELAGVPLRPVLYVEREAFAAAYLVAQMEAGVLAEAPVWSDLAELPEGLLRELRGMAGLGVVGGFPCQPWSVAGKREGTGDERWIWDAIDRIFRAVRPDWCFLENVPGLTRGGLEHVLGTLAEVGLDAEWGCFRADEVGAPHRRERVFVLGAVGHAQLSGLQVGSWFRRATSPSGRDLDPPVAGVKYIGRFPPPPGGPLASAIWPDVPTHLWPALTAEEEAELEVRSLVDGLGECRIDLLRLLGNGVVPQQAALAFRELAERLGQ